MRKKTTKRQPKKQATKKEVTVDDKVKVETKQKVIEEPKPVAMDTYWVEGGVGKIAMFTSLVASLAKKSKTGKINIISPYDDLFNLNPLVENSWNFKSYNAQKERLRALITEIYNYEPYKGSFSIKKDVHLLEDWARGFGIKYNNELPNIAVSAKIKQQVDKQLNSMGKFIVVQFSGGQTPIGFDAKKAYQNNKMQQQRNYPYCMAQHFIYRFKQKYPDITIIDYSLPNEHSGYDGAIRIALPYIAYPYVLSKAETFVGIDSSLAHFAASARKKGVVLWGGIPTHQFGWKMHKNLSNYNGKGGFNKNNPFYIAVDYSLLLNEVSKFMDINN